MKDQDVILNSTGNGTLGRVGFFQSTDNAFNYSIVPDSHVTVIRTQKNVSARYVYYALKYYQPYLEGLGTGSTNQTELNVNTVKAILIPLPSLAEQHRIVARLNELLPLCDTLEEAK